MCAFADAWDEIERHHGSIRLKYLVASQTLSNIMFDKGKNPFQDFDLLFKLRDGHMHLKPQDTEPVKEGTVYVTKPPGYIQALTTRGLASKVEAGVSMSWLNRVQTAEMADWSCQTALNIILALLDMFPDGSHIQDVAHGFKLIFRPDNGWPKPWNKNSRFP